MERVKALVIGIGVLCSLFLVMIYVIMLYVDYSDKEERHIAGAYYCHNENTPEFAILNMNNNAMDIPPRVLKYRSNDKFITAIQKPEIPQSANFIDVSYPDYSEDSIYYWIIFVDQDTLLGPLDHLSFIRECKKNKVPDDLWLTYPVRSVQ